MIVNKYLLLSATLTLHVFISCCKSVNAQIVPDSSLNTQVRIENDQLTKIQGGEQAGSNLFHSLTTFNINEGQEVQFENLNSAVNIFTRVTGSPSTLNGTISTLNPANLYILNKNGVIFGESIELNTNGSLFVSTASSIDFADGIRFSSGLNQDNRFLSASAPSLINFTGDSGQIQVNGRGNTLDRDQATTLAIGAGQSTSGIRLAPNQQVVFLGDGIEFNKGLLTAVSGDITLGSVNEGSIGFSGFQRTEANSILDFTQVSKYSDIDILDRSIVDATGFVPSRIRLVGENLELSGGSYVVIQAEGPNASGQINIDFQDSILVQGINDNPNLPSSFSPLRNSSGFFAGSVLAQGVGISVQARELQLIDAGVIGSTATFGGFGGDIDVQVSESILIKGDILPDPLSAFSTIFVSSNGEGVSGAINLRTKKLQLFDHGTIQSVSLSTSDSKPISVIADDSITLKGISPVSGDVSIIQTSTFQDGTSADLTVKTKNLFIEDGSIVGSLTLASGSSGNVIVDASDSIQISGFRIQGDGVIQQSAIGSFASGNDEALQVAFGLPAFPSGDVGTTQIKTNNLSIRNNGIVSSGNEGTGDTGTLEIIARMIQLNRGNIFSFANQGDGGDVELSASLLSLTDASNISVNSFQGGSGGDIRIDTELLLLDKDSSIVANSSDARGGNISINTTGLFVSPDSQITASSSLGESFSGAIDINSPNIDLQRAATSIETTPDLPKLAVVCNSTGTESELSVAGSAGVPISSKDYLDSRIKFYSQGKISGEPLLITDPVTEVKEKFERFVGWKVRTKEDGRRVASLVADPNEAIQFQSTRTACLNNTQPT